VQEEWDVCGKFGPTKKENSTQGPKGVGLHCKTWGKKKKKVNKTWTGTKNFQKQDKRKLWIKDREDKRSKPKKKLEGGTRRQVVGNREGKVEEQTKEETTLTPRGKDV